MNNPDYRKAEKKAAELLKECYINAPPVVANEIAEHLRINVVLADFSKVNSLLANIAGFMSSENQTIYVNCTDSIKRRNFTIAHEIGHFLLKHTGTSEYSDLIFRSPYAAGEEKPPMEKEADCFAANLLVPKNFLQKVIKNYPYISDAQLSNIFGVNEIVIRIRKQNAGV